MKKIKIGNHEFEVWQVGATVIVVGLGIYAYMTSSRTSPVPTAEPEETNPQSIGYIGGGESQSLDEVYNLISENNKEIAKAFDRVSSQFEDYQSNTDSTLAQMSKTFSSLQYMSAAVPQTSLNENDLIIGAIKTKYGIDVSSELNSGGKAYAKDGSSGGKKVKNVYVANAKGGVTKIITPTQEKYNKLSSSDRAKVDKIVKDYGVDAEAAMSGLK